MSHYPDLLTMEDLDLHIMASGRRNRDSIPLLRDISFSIRQGESVCLVGESGCGKSITLLTVMGLLPPSLFRIVRGRILFRGEEITSEQAVRSIRGSRIGMVFQEPMTALNPVFTIGFQIEEAITTHVRCGAGEVREKVISLLHQVGMSDPEAMAVSYPHQLSGGLRQRAMIAMALACDPDLLMADEPTTALDVTIQSQILDLLLSLQEQREAGLLLVTHNLGVVARVASKVLIMYAGRIVEDAPVRELFRKPLHPYTEGLLASVPYAAPVTHGHRLHSIPGSVPPLDRLPQGCAFQDRCPSAMKICREQVPDYICVEQDRRAACHLYT